MPFFFLPNQKHAICLRLYYYLNAVLHTSVLVVSLLHLLLIILELDYPTHNQVPLVKVFLAAGSECILEVKTHR